MQADISILSCEPGLWKNVLIIVHGWLKIKEENEISGLLKGKFYRLPNAPEARREKALVPVLLRITHHLKSGLLDSSANHFPPC